MKNKLGKYNDGVVLIYTPKERKTDFNAPKNVSVLDDMDFVCKLDFEEMSKREQDIEFAEQMGFSLSMKIKTRFVPAVDDGCKAVIDGWLYDISSMDKNKTDAFLYMTQVRKVGENN